MSPDCRNHKPPLIQSSNVKKANRAWALKLARLSIFLLLTLYIGLSPNTFASLEFSPRPFDATKYSIANQLEHEDVWITAANGAKLHGWFFPCSKAYFTVIIHHGQGNNIAHYFSSVKVLRNAGASVLIYDYEGFGLSEGKPSNEALRRDAEAAYLFVRNEKRVSANRIIHCGLSIGTGAACDIACRRECAGIFLISPYWRISDVAKHVVPILRMYPDFAFPQPDLGGHVLAKTKIPVLIIHSIDDPILPFEQAEHIYQVVQGPKHLIRLNANGHLGGLDEGAESLCKQWLAELEKRF